MIGRPYGRRSGQSAPGGDDGRAAGRDRDGWAGRASGRRRGERAVGSALPTIPRPEPGRRRHRRQVQAAPAATVDCVSSSEVAARWRSLRSARPEIRAREAAAELGVSEAELVASAIGDTAVRLEGSSASLLHALSQVGRCRAVTRNESAVSEIRGRYGGISLHGHAGLVLGDRIDLRVFLAHWHHVFAVDEPDPQRAGERRHSIQVFDAAGAAVHEIYLEPDGDAATWDAVVATRTALAPPVMQLTPRPPPFERPDRAIDRDALIADWDAMTDTHEFVQILARHGATRLQALRLAGASRAWPVRDDAIERVLHATAETGDPIMVFVGNRGCIQVFSGAVQRVVHHGPRLDVLDPELDLHLRTDRIAASWVVARPTRSGAVMSLELFDAAGELIAMLLHRWDDCERAESLCWSSLLAQLAQATR